MKTTIDFPGSQDAADSRAETLHHLHRGSSLRRAEGDQASGLRKVHLWRDQLQIVHCKLLLWCNLTFTKTGAGSKSSRQVFCLANLQYDSSSKIALFAKKLEKCALGLKAQKMSSSPENTLKMSPRPCKSYSKSTIFQLKINYYETLFSSFEKYSLWLKLCLFSSRILSE